MPLLLVWIMTPAAHADFFGVAHRGGRMQGPENTLEVFQLTMDLGVFPWFETDSWESSDGVLMLHHDQTLCRTTNIATFPGYDCVVEANNPLGRFPRIRDFTLAELKTLDVGSWFSAAFAGAMMPTLEEALTFMDGTGVPLVVEIKSQGQAPLIEEILTRTGLSEDNLIIWAREVFSYDEFYTLLPTIRQITGLLPLSSVTPAFLADRAAKGDFGIAIQSVNLTQALVDSIHSYGLVIYSLPGISGGDPMDTQITKGIDAFHTDDEVGWVGLLSTRPCVDRIDNDLDGFADFHGIDLDFDGIHEVPPDPACTTPLDLTEVAECQDGIDNDGDSFIDLADSDCMTENSLSETGPFCGDTVITPPETCDDGNTLAGDGCYSTCLIESSATIFGTADGGSVTATISGVVVMITTNPGDTAALVAANLAITVNVDSTLQGLGLSAESIGGSFYTDGTIDSIAIADTGLATPAMVPVLIPVGWIMLALSLAIAGGLALAKRGRDSIPRRLKMGRSGDASASH